MTDSQKRSIYAMRRRGMSYGSIASELGLSHNTVKSFCRREALDSHITDKNPQSACKNCGAPLTQVSGKKQRIFCSDKCRRTWWNQIYTHSGTYHLICAHCGTGFRSKDQKRKFCGRECYIKSRYGEGLS